MFETDTIIFLGPSLKIAEAKAILPNAGYLPPVRCGDILRVMRLNPKVICIIDGYFEHAAAVWHKEILCAMEHGIAVYGASSMGALRAAELYTFGMFGVGKIFNDYKSGVLNDDDEVALLHAPETSNYAPLSDAMVNIRATLELAIKKEILSAALATKIISNAKKLPYPQRHLNKIVAGMLQQEPLIKNFVTWLNAGNFVDQKKTDAVLVLKNIASDSSAPLPRNTTAKTIFLRTLQTEIMCKPFHVKRSWFPKIEQVALYARLLGDNYRALKRLAYLWAAAIALAKARANCFLKTEAEPIFPKSAIQPLNERINLINQLLRWQKEATLVSNLPSVDKYLLDLFYLAADYSSFRQENQALTLQQLKQIDPLRYKILYYSAILWRAIDAEAEKLTLRPTDSELQNFFEQFRMQRAFYEPEKVEKWCQERDMTFEAFTLFLKRVCSLNFLVLQNNLDSIDAWQDDGATYWLADMLYLTGAFEVAEGFLLDSEKKQKQINILLTKKTVKNDHDAYAIDFLGGEAELLAMLKTNSHE